MLQPQRQANQKTRRTQRNRSATNTSTPGGIGLIPTGTFDDSEIKTANKWQCCGRPRVAPTPSGTGSTKRSSRAWTPHLRETRCVTGGSFTRQRWRRRMRRSSIFLLRKRRGRLTIGSMSYCGRTRTKKNERKSSWLRMLFCR
jgi:hypothetical protein